MRRTRMALPGFLANKLRARLLYYYAASRDSLSVEVGMRSLAKLWELPDNDDLVRSVAEETVKLLPPSVDVKVKAGSVRVSMGGSDDERAAAREAFEYWRDKMRPGGRPVFRGKRRSCIIARLRDGASVEYIKRGVDGLAASEYHAANGYDDIELVCRDPVHLDRFARMAPESDRDDGQEQRQDEEEYERRLERWGQLTDDEKHELLQRAEGDLDPTWLDSLGADSRTVVVRNRAMEMMDATHDADEGRPR